MNNKSKKFDYLQSIKDKSVLQVELKPLLMNHSAEDFADCISRIALEGVFRIIYGFYPQPEHGKKLDIVKQLQRKFSIPQ